MLNHPVTSLTNGARLRQESLLADAASRHVTDRSKQRMRRGLITSAVLLAFRGVLGNCELRR